MNEDIILQQHIDNLKHQDRNVRYSAAEALGELKDTRAVPALIEALMDAYHSVRETTTRAFVNIGAPAVPALIEALKNEDKYVRSNAAQALETLGNPYTLPRKILMEKLFPPLQRMEMLNSLRQVTYRDKRTTLCYRFPDTRTLCQKMLMEEDAEAQTAAKEVLVFLDSLRPLQPAPSTDRTQLLRAAEGSIGDTRPEMLLRSSEVPMTAHSASPQQKGLRERLQSLLKREKD